MKGGLFTKQDARTRRATPRSTVGGPSAESVRQIGPSAVKGMSPQARTPNLQPYNNAVKPGDKVILVLGGFPTISDDQRGRHLTGPARLLREELPVGGTAFDFVCRTMTKWKQNKSTKKITHLQPTDTQLAAFRNDVEANILELRPKAIIITGHAAMRWLYPGLVRRYDAVRGRRIPFTIGDHTCWVYPVSDPSFLAEWSGNRRFKDVPGTEWNKYFRKDIARMIKDVRAEHPPVPPYVSAAGCDTKLVRVLETADVGTLRRMVRSMKQPVFDIETNGLRCYKKGAKILSIAFGDEDAAVSIGIDHPGCNYSKVERHAVIDTLRSIFADTKFKHGFIAHNTPFDLEWCAHVLGHDIIDAATHWHDTLAGAYILDERGGALSLDYLCVQHFGFRLKHATPGAQFRSSLDTRPLQEVLLYGGMDTLWTARLHTVQMKQINARKLTAAYQHQTRRIPAFIKAQLAGVPIDTSYRDEFKVKLESQVKDVLTRMRTMPEVKEASRRLQATFDPNKTEHAVMLLKNVLGRTEGFDDHDPDAYTTDAASLEPILEEVPAAKLLLEFRGCSKLLSTYVMPMFPDYEKTVMWPDGLLHCLFETTRTATGRTSSKKPNNQNWPKRKAAWIRGMIRAPQGYTIVSADYGQIEARVIGMMSKDAEFCKALWADYDVHMDWAERIARKDPSALTSRGNSMKALRTAVKNEMVFPAFFGASEKSIAGFLSIDEFVAADLFEEFWEIFAGVKAWQDELIRFYNRKGYVECLTGRRRRGPMSTNMIINSPVQGTASDIVVEAMSGLSERAGKEDKPWLAPILNIHDDLTLMIPDVYLEEGIEDVVTEMVGIKYPWINVPISIEVEVGKSWDAMSAVGVFRSDELQ